MNWFVGLLMLCAANASAVCKVQKLPETYRVFTSLYEVLAFARESYATHSARLDVEFVGVVRRTPAGYSNATYRGCRHHGSFNLALHDTASVLALWHTHGAPGRLRGYFSTQDAQIVRTLHRPMYLLSAKSAQRVLMPSDVAKPSRRLRAAGSLAQRVLGYRGQAVQQSLEFTSR